MRLDHVLTLSDLGSNDVSNRSAFPQTRDEGRCLRYRSAILACKEMLSDFVSAGIDGSGVLNQHFGDLLERLLKKSVPTAFLDQKRAPTSEIKTRIKAEAIKSFEEQKKQFGSRLDKETSGPMRIRAPGLQREIRHSRNTLPSDCIEISRFFVPIID